MFNEDWSTILIQILIPFLVSITLAACGFRNETREIRGLKNADQRLSVFEVAPDLKSKIVNRQSYFEFGILKG